MPQSKNYNTMTGPYRVYSVNANGGGKHGAKVSATNTPSQASSGAGNPVRNHHPSYKDVIYEDDNEDLEVEEDPSMYRVSSEDTPLASGAGAGASDIVVEHPYHIKQRQYKYEFDYKQHKLLNDRQHRHSPTAPSGTDSNPPPHPGGSDAKGRVVKDRFLSRAALLASILAVILCALVLATSAMGGWRISKADEPASTSSSSRINNQTANPSGSGSTNKGSGGDNRSPHTLSVGPPKLPADPSGILDYLGRFIIEDYDAAPTFADFLPSMAGYYGKPLYAFYVNRGQAIASFGINSKDSPMMEFEPASKAYRKTGLQGFRTFVRLSRQESKSIPTWIEPFSALTTRFAPSEDHLPKRTMYVGSNTLLLQEVDDTHALETNVTFFILPDEDFGAFVKRTTFTNLEKNVAVTISLVDGLAKMEPAAPDGFPMNAKLKESENTLESWMNVYQPYNDSIQMPYYRVATTTKQHVAYDASSPMSSSSETGYTVVQQEAGHWCLSVIERDPLVLLPVIYDPSKVFGQDTTMLRPVYLYHHDVADVVRQPQYAASKSACAFAALDTYPLEPGQSITISTFFGKAQHILDVPVIARRLLQPGFGLYKETRARSISNQVTQAVETHTAHPLWDGHVQQMFLDNSLLGGVPNILGDIDDMARMRNTDEDPRIEVVHLFSRRLGDLERDTENFVIKSTFFSEESAGFRRVVQNRRNDVIVNPRIGSFNVKTFLSFIQVDGYEPGTIDSVYFAIPDLETCKQIATRAVGEADGHRAQREELTGMLNAGPFRLGPLFARMEQEHVLLIVSRQDFVDLVAASSEAVPSAEYTDGYWADHWLFYMNMIRSYLSVYPEWEERIMFDASIPYFFSPAFVKPRSQKYVLIWEGDRVQEGVRQINATDHADAEKVAYQEEFLSRTPTATSYTVKWQHDEEGNRFQSSPMAKLFLLATIKFATRDPLGMGIEYEGGFATWESATSGLAEIMGSGMPETYALVELLRFVQTTVSLHSRAIIIPAELIDLIVQINTSIDLLTATQSTHTGEEAVNSTVPDSLFHYWDTVATAREAYRQRTKVLVSGNTTTLSSQEVADIIDKWLIQIELGIARAMKLGTTCLKNDDDSGLSPTYFSYDVLSWKSTKELSQGGLPLVRPKTMAVRCYPLFLEGPTRLMRIVDRNETLQIYNKVRSSPLRDKKLGMYTVSESLQGQSYDLGRGMGFAPGWLDNQSVWLHQTYRFYLELLRKDLFVPFFDEMTQGAMLPFMDPNVYGRSLMECSSFISSSAFEDPSSHGQGFFARMSGATTEFINMWILMMIGPEPFFYDESGAMCMQLVPALPRWLFKDGANANPATVSFKLFSSISVTYHHALGEQHLFRVKPSRYVVGLLDGTIYHVNNSNIPSNLADKIRRVVFIASIDVYFEP